MYIVVRSYRKTIFWVLLSKLNCENIIKSLKVYTQLQFLIFEIQGCVGFVSAFDWLSSCWNSVTPSHWYSECIQMYITAAYCKMYPFHGGKAFLLIDFYQWEWVLDEQTAAVSIPRPLGRNLALWSRMSRSQQLERPLTVTRRRQADRGATPSTRRTYQSAGVITRQATENIKW